MAYQKQSSQPTDSLSYFQDLTFDLDLGVFL